MSLELPDWYTLKDPGELSINVSQWIVFAEKRLERLLENNPWIIIPSSYHAEEWEQMRLQEIGGHFLLRLVSSTNPRLTSWLVEVEGDLFEFRFINAPSFEEKFAVISDLFGSENVKTIKDINKMFNIDIHTKYNIVDSIKSPSLRRRISSSSVYSSKTALERYIAIAFYKIPSLISTKKVLLHKGWAIIQLADLRLVLKREFEKQFKSIVEKSRVFLQEDASLRSLLSPLQDTLNTVARSSRLQGDLSNLGFEGDDDAFTKTDCFPPCIQDLINILTSKGHLNHSENWQLGTFLKRLGMSVDQQYKFWYSNAVDNLGISFDEFVNRIGYQIRHLYGQEGGGTDYEPPKCKTCIEGFYCYFAHKRLEDISDDMKIKFKQKDEKKLEETIDSISQLIVKQWYQEACARYFEFYTSWTVKEKRINHMLQYSKGVYKRFYAKKKPQTESNTKSGAKEDISYE